MPNQTAIRCPNCSFQFPASVQSVIDATLNPQAKAQLLSGVTNTFPCPNCGAAVQIKRPLMYHDGAKELLLVFVPPELNLSKPDREKVIGDMMRELTGMLPSGSFRSYMFQPRESLTMQGMLDTILQADGITPEMMATQRERMRVLEEVLSAPPEARAGIVAKNDSIIDATLVQMLTLLLQRMSAEGNNAAAQQVALAQRDIMEYSSFGQSLMHEAEAEEETVAAVADRIQALGENASHADFVNLAIEMSEDNIQLQALVGLARPAFDYTFFQMLTERIGKAPAAKRDALQNLRDRLLAMTQAMDAELQAVLQQAAELLQTLASARDEQALDELISANMDDLDEHFLSVLVDNIEHAEQQQNHPLLERLQLIYGKVINALKQNMPPELRLMNELLGTENEDQARALIRDGLKQFGSRLLEVFASVREVVRQRGEAEAMARFNRLEAIAHELAG